MKSSIFQVLLKIILQYIIGIECFAKIQKHSDDPGHSKNELFCFKTVNNLYELNSHNSLSEILWFKPQKYHNLNLHGKENRSIACISSSSLDQYNNSCWNIKVEKYDQQTSINFITEIIQQFYPSLESIYSIKNFFKTSTPHCMGAVLHACTNHTDIQLKINLLNQQNYYEDSLYAFENKYESFFSSHKDHLQICFVPSPVMEFIQCSENPYYHEEVPKTALIFKRDLQIANKSFERNSDCIPLHPIVFEEYNTPTKIVITYSILHGISLIFLILYIIKCLMFTKFRKYPRILILWIVISIFIARIMAIILLNLRIPSDSFECFILAYLYNIFILAIYTCFSVTSFDTWFALKMYSVDPPCRQSKKGRLKKYAAVAWGVPILLSSIQLMTEYLSPPKTNFHFAYWKNSCIYWSNINQIIFYTVPTAIILLTNVFFFASAFCKLKKIKTMMSLRNRNKKVAIILLRLFLLCGFPWAVSLITDITNLYSRTVVLYYFSMVVCSAQAFLIWLFFGFQKETREKLRRKLTNSIKGEIPPTSVTSDVISSKDQSTGFNNIYVLQSSANYLINTNINKTSLS